MNILIAASEVAPFAKTGGLADVVGSIPKHLHKLGHEVSVVMPFYRTVRENKSAAEGAQPTGIAIEIPIGEKKISGSILKSFLPKSSVPIYFIACPQYFDREQLYGPKGKDYADNSERFIFFSRAIIETIRTLNPDVEVVHCNDWQTALVPVYLKTLYADDPRLSKVGTLFTIHNLAYQGLFWHWDMKLTGLSWDLFNWRQLEFFGQLNLMKGGLVFSDILNTVSKTYAQEIQTTDEFGKGLEDVLRSRANDLYGIVNGVDYADWDPAKDNWIPAAYGPAMMAGKAKCKEHLQRKNNLPVGQAPLIGMIGRLDPQKGWDLVEAIIDELMKRNVQLVILGTGNERYHKLLDRIAGAYPKKAGINLAFDNQLAHEIEAGSDMFLMPSRYEPCGLNQLYSLKYGTVPIVRRTGGLADTIVDCSPQTIQSREANGFSFEKYSPEALLRTIDRALRAYADKKVWQQLMEIGMRQDWSWKRSAKEYEALYQEAQRKRLAEGK